jgi:sec-independent protein translocase protein TatB
MFDFGVGYSELFVLALVAIIVIGPKDLPKVLRTFGQMMTKMRGMAREFQGHVDVAMKDAGVADLKKDMQSLKNMASMQKNSVSQCQIQNPTTSKHTLPTNRVKRELLANEALNRDQRRYR